MRLYATFSKRCKMSTQSLPAPSLRTGHGLPAVRWVSRVVNYLIYQALWVILPAISGSKPSFLPALRDAVDQARILTDVFLGDRIAGKLRPRRCCTASPQSHLLSHGFPAVG